MAFDALSRAPNATSGRSRALSYEIGFSGSSTVNVHSPEL